LGYYQIIIAIDDEEKSVYHSVQYFLLHQYGIWAKERGKGGTYQKCVHIILEAQIGRNVEAYIDDILVKSKKQGDLLDDLKETFDNLRKYNMMLNPKKCVFGVSSRKLLGYMISSRGIDANPKKVEAIETIAAILDQKRNPEASKT
jgi:hypothetical protein